MRQAVLLNHRDLEVRRVATAKALQRKGLTFTEIAQQMRVSRESVVDALYWSLS